MKLWEIQLVYIGVVVCAWALLVYFDRSRWRIITGRMGLLLGVVTLGISLVSRFTGVQ